MCLMKTKLGWNILATREVDGGGAPAGLGEERVAPGDSGQHHRREQVEEERKVEAIALVQLGTTDAV